MATAWEVADSYQSTRFSLSRLFAVSSLRGIENMNTPSFHSVSKRPLIVKRPVIHMTVLYTLYSYFVKISRWKPTLVLATPTSAFMPAERVICQRLIPNSSPARKGKRCSRKPQMDDHIDLTFDRHVFPVGSANPAASPRNQAKLVLCAGPIALSVCFPQNLE